jgi:uncharacterized membrane protein YgdD (TMEM256/DUF423 family)
MPWVSIAAALAALAVAAGAFGAHALKGTLTPDQAAVYQTAVHYHLVHAVALFALALYGRHSGTAIGSPAALFLGGVVLFSGSLYALVLTSQRWLGPVTPLGGLCFIAAWLTAAWLFLKP